MKDIILACAISLILFSIVIMTIYQLKKRNPDKSIDELIATIDLWRYSPYGFLLGSGIAILLFVANEFLLGEGKAIEVAGSFQEFNQIYITFRFWLTLFISPFVYFMVILVLRHLMINMIRKIKELKQ